MILELSQNQIISLSINLAVFVLAIIISLIVIKFIKVQNKGYKLLFIFYTVFWIPLMLLRNYTGPMHSAMDISGTLLFLPMAAYGFIGIFARPLNDYLAWIFRSRKAVIFLVMGIEIVTFIPIIINPCLATNIVQSLGVGLGASCIGMYQLYFNEQYGKGQFFLTVSILSLPPLLADFISSPLQSFVVSFSENGNTPTPEVMKYLWVVGLIFIVIGFIIGFFTKENRNFLYQDKKYKKEIKGKNDWIIFVLILLIGTLLSFVKFSNSGSIAQQQLNFLGENVGVNTASFQGYLSLVFSFSQLIAGLLTGLFLIKRIGKLSTFSIGCFLWIIYEICSIFITDPYGYMGVHCLNGFSYGIVYNLVLGGILQQCFKTNKSTPMGVYQAVLSAGIMASTWFTSWLKGPLFGNKDFQAFEHASLIINSIIIGAIVLMWILFIFCEWYTSKVKSDTSGQTLKLKKETEVINNENMHNKKLLFNLTINI